MRAGSFDVPPIDAKAVDQGVDLLGGLVIGDGAQVGVFSGGEDRVMTEDFLDFEQVDARFD
jgi:hypothetical protein